MAIVCHHPPLPKTGTHPTWVTDTEPKGLPPLTECVARAIFHSGRSKGDVSKAVQIAMGRVEDWAKGIGGVKPDTIAKAKADVAILKAKLAQTKGKRAASLSQAYRQGVIDLATRVSTARSAQPVTVAGPVTMATRRKMAARGRALPGGRFPIRNHQDVKKAIRAVGRARSKAGKSTPQERALVRRHIIRNAKRIGAEHLVPQSWKADGSLG